MRTSALIALLPLLANVASAHPHHKHDRSVRGSNRVRKSLSFGPTHSHASFEVLEQPIVVQSFTEGEVDAKRVASQFIAEKVGAGEGEGFFIRDDVSISFYDFNHSSVIISTASWHNG